MTGTRRYLRLHVAALLLVHTGLQNCGIRAEYFTFCTPNTRYSVTSTCPTAECDLHAPAPAQDEEACTALCAAEYDCKCAMYEVGSGTCFFKNKACDDPAMGLVDVDPTSPAQATAVTMCFHCHQTPDWWSRLYSSSVPQPGFPWVHKGGYDGMDIYAHWANGTQDCQCTDKLGWYCKDACIGQLNPPAASGANCDATTCASPGDVCTYWNDLDKEPQWMCKPMPNEGYCTKAMETGCAWYPGRKHCGTSSGNLHRPTYQDNAQLVGVPCAVSAKDMDRRGGDLRQFSDSSVQDCYDACMSDAVCSTFTYGVGGCFLKSSEAASSNLTEFPSYTFYDVRGCKDTGNNSMSLAPPAEVLTGDCIQAYPDKDHSGGNLALIQDISVLECYKNCMATAGCSMFTFGGGGCFLKDMATASQEVSALVGYTLYDVRTCNKAENLTPAQMNANGNSSVAIASLPPNASGAKSQACCSVGLSCLMAFCALIQLCWWQS